MADVYINIYVYDGTNYPIVSPINSIDLVVTINGVDYSVYPDGYVSVLVPENSTVGILIEYPNYESYSGYVDVLDVDYNLQVVLTPLETSDFINIVKDCHTFTISNNGTSSDDNVTYTITDLDGNIIDNNEDIVLDFETNKSFTSSKDNIYIVIVKNDEGNIIRNYVIIDYCDITECISNRILDILCDCDCNHSDCEDICKNDFEMKRIFLLQNDLFNRINTEYRLNSYYETLDDMKVTELKTAKDDIDKLNSYCSSCGNNKTSVNTLKINNNFNSGCGCS